MKTTAQGKQGSTAKTVYVHLTGIWISEVTHPSYATAWEVGWCDEGNAWRGPRVFIRVFESKREAWTYLASVTKNPNEGIVIPAEKKAA